MIVVTLLALAISNAASIPSKFDSKVTARYFDDWINSFAISMSFLFKWSLAPATIIILFSPLSLSTQIDATPL